MTIKFNPSLLRMLPTYENCFSVSRTLKKIIGAIFDSAKEGLNDTSWISWFLKIILKNCFISPIPQMPTSSHKSCLPPRVKNGFPMLVKVIKNPVPAIKSKEVSYPIRRNKYDPYLICTHAVSENMKSSLFLHPTTRAHRGYAHTPPTSAVIW
jgi:hypothetical protein